MDRISYRPKQPFAYYAARLPDFEMIENTGQEFARQRYKDPYSYGRDPYVRGLIFQPTPLGERMLICFQLAHRLDNNFTGIEFHPMVDCLLDVIYDHYVHDFSSVNFTNERDVVVTAAVLNQSCRHFKDTLAERSLTGRLNRYPLRWKNDEIALSKLFKLWQTPKYSGMLNVVFIELHHMKLPVGTRPDSREMVQYIGESTKNIIVFLKDRFNRGFLGGSYKLLRDPDKHILGLFLGFNGTKPHCHDPVNIGNEIGDYFREITEYENQFINHAEGALYDQGIGHISSEERHREDYLMQAIHNFVYADYYASLPTNIYGGTRFGIIDNT